MPGIIDLTGQTFGRLHVICRAENKRISKRKTVVMWKCKCTCGKVVEVNGTYLRNGDTTSCGCFAKDLIIQRNTKHGLKHQRLYSIWKDMKRRCNNPIRYAHEYYHDKGVSVCKEWGNDFKAFYEWAVVNGYNDDLTIDRINSNGDYEPDNCRWVTMKVQGNNKTNNIVIEYNGEKKTVSEWAEMLGMQRNTLYSRIKIYNWSVEKAFSTPVVRRRSK